MSDSTASPIIQEMPEQERPREKLIERGAGALTDAELLAIFLGKGRRGVSAIELGRELLEKFGSLQGIARQGVAGLSLINGIGPAKAAQIAGICEFGRRLARETYTDRPIDNPEAVYELLGPEMRALSQESLRLVLLDTRCNLLLVVEITRGSVNESIAHPREIFRHAFAHAASSFILVHNHPSGDPSPSRADISLTKRLREASELIQIEMFDHVIIGSPSSGGDAAPYFSFREMGML